MRLSQVAHRPDRERICRAFRKDDWKTNRRFGKDFEDYAGPAHEQIEAERVPSWIETLKGAMELGNVTVKACSATMESAKSD